MATTPAEQNWTSLSHLNPTERFTDRVENYVKYRPRYPQALLDGLRAEAGLKPGHVIADLGSGTGPLSELFLAEGYSVLGIEPNAGMRQAAERLLLPRFPKFHSLRGTAEATTLIAHSVDFVTAGQAFHWFEPNRMKAEALHVLKPGGTIALIWNDRQDADPLGREYEGLLVDYGIDYRAVAAKYRFDDEPMRDFFKGGTFFKRLSFPNAQWLTRAAFLGRLLSASYAPNAGHPNHEPMLRAADKLFDKYRQGDVVHMPYETKAFIGRFG